MYLFDKGENKMSYDFIIKVPFAFLYTKPNINSPVADEALYGMSCRIVSEIDDFFEVKMFYGYNAFIEKKNIGKGKMGSRVICTPFADFLDSPDYSKAPVTTLQKGSRVSAEIEVKGRFTKVVFDNGRVLYTHTSNIKKYQVTPPNYLREALVATAKSYLGSGYRWGGKSPSGIDCSGLTFMSYYLNGYIVYRDADKDKFKNFDLIDLKNAEKGDLLFFPGHIGMYIGEGEFIHSNSAFGGVTINSLEQNSPLFSRIHFEQLEAVMTLRDLR